MCTVPGTVQYYSCFSELSTVATILARELAIYSEYSIAETLAYTVPGNSFNDATHFKIRKDLCNRLHSHLTDIRLHTTIVLIFVLTLASFSPTQRPWAGGCFTKRPHRRKS